MSSNDRAASPVEWLVTPGLTAYNHACAAMAARVEAIAAGAAPELVWLLEHPPLYSAGTSAKPHDLVDPGRLPVYRTGRGGQFTYHGPGQRIGYVMLDAGRRFGDVRALVASLEDWIIEALAALGVAAGRRPGHVGVWVGADKIAAIGIRLRRWVTSHGFSLNVAPDLAHYAGIVPCGVRDGGITSLSALGLDLSLTEVDAALQHAFERRLGPTLGVPGLARALTTA
jgi:lipoyl(octanoyl) transferase